MIAKDGKGRRNAPLDADVIIVGAGVAGLEAARRLEAAGLETVILEARPRVGGRIETLRLAGWPGPVEAGAEFVHGRPGALVTRLRQARARLVEIAPRHALVRRGEVIPAGWIWRETQRWLDALPSEDVAVGRLLDGPSHGRRLGSEVRELVRGYVEGFNAADARRVSALGLRRQAEASRAEHAEHLYRVRDGYDQLPEALARGLMNGRRRLWLGVAVTEVRRSEAGVEVRCESSLGGPPHTLRSRAALVTVPLGVLQQRAGARGAIRFSPALPRGHREAIARLAMGRVIKVVVRFREALGVAPLGAIPGATGFLHAPGSVVPTWWVPSPLPPRCLVGWLAGPRADRFAARYGGPDRARARAAVAIAGLGRALRLRPGALEAAVEDARVFDWGEDPWAAGAYSWVPRGGLQAPAALATPVDDRVFFAGEATDTGGDPGTVHGALATAARAAEQIDRRYARA
jgi:monoamine oxidase